LKLTANHRFLNWLEEGIKISSTFPMLSSGWLGKLGLKDEAAGKIRIFAMVDCITQWIIRPLHDRIFQILRVIPQDGTFDQLAPIKRLIKTGKTRFWSFDLSAATDRLPILLQAVIMSCFITSHGANLWITLLVARAYKLPARAQDEFGVKSVMYAVGQPIGALTSWAMLALTHHAIVQWSAFRAGVVIAGQWFKDYAILGDDLVIANEQVADEYLRVVREIGVHVGLHKSVQDRFGHRVIEFAKRVWSGGILVGPVSIMEVVAAFVSLSNWLELAKKGNLSLSQALAVLGYKWRALSTISSRWGDMPRRLRVYVSSWYAPGGPAYTSLLSFFRQTAVGESTLPEPSGDYLRELVQDLLKRILALRSRIVPLTKMVEVDRTRAHYGTSIWSPSQWPHLEIPGPLTLAQVTWVMSLCEYCYREAFYDILSNLTALERLVESIQEDISPEVVESLLERLQSLEDDLSVLGMSQFSTRRKDEARGVFKFVKGGTWARRWVRWYRHAK
jgi:hypothetical protein